MVRRVVGSIPHGGPFKLIPMVYTILRVYDVAYKITLAANQNE